MLGGMLPQKLYGLAWAMIRDYDPNSFHGRKAEQTVSSHKLQRYQYNQTFHFCGDVLMSISFEGNGEK